jgi:hypothetical protein
MILVPLLFLKQLNSFSEHKTSWDTLYFFGSDARNLYVAMDVEAPGNAYRPIAHSLAEVLGEHRNTRQNEKPQNLQLLMERYQTSKCADCRDKVFAFLALSGDVSTVNGFEVDYSMTATEIFLEVVVFQRFLATQAVVHMPDYRSPGAQYLAIALWRALQITIATFDQDKARSRVTLHYSKYPNLSSRGFKVSATDLGTISYVERPFSTTPYSVFRCGRSNKPDLDGVASPVIANGHFVYELDWLDSGIIGFWKDSQFHVVSRYCKNVPDEQAEIYDQLSRLHQELFVGKALEHTVQLTTGMTWVMEPGRSFAGQNERRVDIFHLDYKQFLSLIVEYSEFHR